MKGKIRIIGGRWRGRRLVVPEQPGLRPSGDRGRETLFNWLSGRVPGSRCLDLFAGTGALGLEAASRGAARVVLVEKDRVLVSALQALRERWDGAEMLEVVPGDARRVAGLLDGPFDLIFLDPPFGLNLESEALEWITAHGLLAPGGLVYLETASAGAGQVLVPTGWRVVRDKVLGGVRLRLLETGQAV